MRETNLGLRRSPLRKRRGVEMGKPRNGAVKAAFDGLCRPFQLHRLAGRSVGILSHRLDDTVCLIWVTSPVIAGVLAVMMRVAGSFSSGGFSLLEQVMDAMRGGGDQECQEKDRGC
jgi:hypothetical protein